MRVAPRHLIALLALGALLCVAIFASQADADTSARQSAGRPDQAVLVTAAQPTPGAALLVGLGDGYLSPVTAAPRPFTHALLRWEAAKPVSATLALELRVSADGSNWSDWAPVLENPDMWVPADGDELFWSQDLYAGEGVNFWQLRATRAPGPDGRLPELRRVEVNTVDARFGPAAPVPSAELRAQANSNIARPSVVRRVDWGSPDGQGSRVAPVHYPVKHLVVHHTADANRLSGSEQRWSDRVRAIWSFHTYTRGWGDIGYNYLIDPNGVVYEGRAGGDDAVAFHDTANYGSMGVVLIGTYASVAPTTASTDRLVELLAWKAAQKGIDPLGRSFYYGCSASKYCKPYHSGSLVENIAGHRQVTPGHTTCPGDSLLNTLPTVRQRVQARINGAAPGDDGDLTIDERESSFVRAGATDWYEQACGYGGSTSYTFATNNPAEAGNRGVWTPNIPEAGLYKVLVHLPKGCELGQPTASARYRVQTADGLREITVDQGASDEWVALGVFRFAVGRAGSVELGDLTGEPLSARRVILFDSVRWVKADAQAAHLELLQVRYDRTTVPVGELLKVTFTVRNSGNAAIDSQDPQAGRLADALASFDAANGYVYDEDECFLGAMNQDYPAYPKEAGRFRVMLGPANRAPSCDGESGGYPWRWGLNGRLEPGQTREVVGYLRFNEPGNVALQAGAIQEYVDYMARGVGATTISVVPERQSPAPTSYDERLRPLAQVYRLGAIPDNLLARSVSALSIPRGDYVGSFAWQGETLDWGEGAPLKTVPELVDGFVVEQTRVFVAPVAGEYTFQVESDDGAWLWVNSAPVVVNPGLHGAATVTGTITLDAGRHVLGFKYFERSGGATVGYSVRVPGQVQFSLPIDGLGGVDTTVEERLGATFRQLDGLTLAADDLGGAGVSTLRVSFDGEEWRELSGRVLSLGSLPDGQYTLHYKAVDGAGNESLEQRLRFTVDARLELRRVYLPLTGR